MKLYVEAKSKADLIRRLAAGEEISGFNYSMFGGGGHYMLDDNLEDGTIIAVYTKKVQGNPVAKAWGTWTNKVLKAESYSSEDDFDEASWGEGFIQEVYSGDADEMMYLELYANWLNQRNTDYIMRTVDDPDRSPALWNNVYGWWNSLTTQRKEELIDEDIFVKYYNDALESYGDYEPFTEGEAESFAAEFLSCYECGTDIEEDDDDLRNCDLCGVLLCGGCNRRCEGCSNTVCDSHRCSKECCDGAYCDECHEDQYESAEGFAAETDTYDSRFYGGSRMEERKSIWQTAGVMGLTVIVAGAAYIWLHKQE